MTQHLTKPSTSASDLPTDDEMLPSMSVLIPCYNGLPFVLETVHSALQQADGGVECVVVDDGSTDGSAHALHEAFGSKIRLIRQSNAGVAAARNRAIIEARGELVVWFDADDVLAPRSLEMRRRAFADDPGLEMFVGQVEVVDMDTGSREIFPQPPCDASYLRNGLLGRRNVPHLDVLTFRRSALAKVGPFDINYRIVDDWAFMVRAWGRLRWSFVPVVQAYQRQGSHDSLTHRMGKIAHYREQSLMLTRNRVLIRQLLGSDVPWRRAYAAFAADFSLVLLNKGMRREAFVWASRALVGSTVQVKLRGLKYLLEALAPSLYRGLRCVYRGLRLVFRLPWSPSFPRVARHFSWLRATGWLK